MQCFACARTSMACIDLFTSAVTYMSAMPIYRAYKENILLKCQLKSWLNISLKNLGKNLFEIAETLELPRIKFLDNFNAKEMCSLFFYC